MKYLIVFQVRGTNRYGCMIDKHPEHLSDFRDHGDPCDVVLTCPLPVAIAAPDLLAACKVTLRLLREHGHTHEAPKQAADYDILDQFDTGLSSPISAVLEAAIAKAEGGAG